jgi:hypothetical protein
MLLQELVPPVRSSTPNFIVVFAIAQVLFQYFEISASPAPENCICNPGNGNDKLQPAFQIGTSVRQEQKEPPIDDNKPAFQIEHIVPAQNGPRPELPLQRLVRRQPHKQASTARVQLTTAAVTSTCQSTNVPSAPREPVRCNATNATRSSLHAAAFVIPPPT